MNVFETIVQRLAHAALIVAGMLLVIVTICMLTVITGRYVGFATAWADEVARITFVWSACLGAVSGIHRRLHFVVFQASNVKNTTARKLLESTSVLLVLGLCLVMAWATTQSLPVAALSSLPAIGLSNAWLHSAVLCFSVLSVLFLAARLLIIWRQLLR